MVKEANFFIRLTKVLGFILAVMTMFSKKYQIIFDGLLLNISNRFMALIAF